MAAAKTSRPKKTAKKVAPAKSAKKAAKKTAAKKTAPAAKKTAAKKAAPAAKKFGARADLGAPVDGFFAKQPPQLAPLLEALRAMIDEAAPEATSTIKW